MELRVLLYIAVFFLYNCKKSTQETFSSKVEVSSEISHKTENLSNPEEIFEYIKIDELKRKNDKFYFKDFSIELVFNVKEQTSFLLISTNNSVSKFKLNDDFDSGEFYLWAYKNKKGEYIYLLELDDYYGSVFYAYHYSHDCLIRLGDFVIQQPNVESEGVKKESFNIKSIDSNIIIDCFLGGEKVSNSELEISKDECLTKSIEHGRDSIVEYPITSEKYSEIKYTPKVVGQTDDIVIFELVGTSVPIVLYTYTDDYLAYLEINKKFVPFFDGYFIEYSSNNKNVFKLLDDVKILKNADEYIIMFPIFSNEFTVFQLIGFNEDLLYKDYGEHTYDGETFEKIIKTPYEERMFYIKTYQNKPRVFVFSENKEFLFNEIYYRSRENYIKLSREQIDYLKQLKKSKNNSVKKGSIVYAQVETYLNIRSAPNLNGDIISKAYPKDSLKVIEVLDDWLKIELNGIQGYISSEFVK